MGISDRRQSLPRRAWGLALQAAVWALLLVITVWATAALAIDVRVSWLRGPLAGLYVLALVVLMAIFRRRARLICLGGFLLVLVWWLTLQPSNGRDWLPDLATLPYAEIAGNKVTIRNIRNCDYRSPTDFTVRHYDRTFDLDKLRTADLFLVYWASPAIAHAMLSFGFEGGDYVCFSIETRKERGETYSTLKGFFRQFELTYVVADERDAVRLRTNYRKGEDVYLYRVRSEPELARKVFLDYLGRVNSLKERAKWYNALTSNCANNVFRHVTPYMDAPWSWHILLPGRLDERIYQRGNLDQTYPFADLKRLSLINDRARKADEAPDFSRRIREGLPGCAD